MSVRQQAEQLVDTTINEMPAPMQSRLRGLRAALIQIAQGKLEQRLQSIQGAYNQSAQTWTREQAALVERARKFLTEMSEDLFLRFAPIYVEEMTAAGLV